MVRPTGAPTAAQRRRLATAARRREAAAQKRDEADQQFFQEVRDIHAEGVSIRQLAETLGHSTSTIQLWLKG